MRTQFFLFSGDRSGIDNREKVSQLLNIFNIPFKEVVGMYKYKDGSIERENSFLVDASHEHRIFELAKNFNQESVLFVDRKRRAFLIYTEDLKTESIGYFKQVDSIKNIEAATFDPISETWWACK